MAAPSPSTTAAPYHLLDFLPDASAHEIARAVIKYKRETVNPVLPVLVQTSKTGKELYEFAIDAIETTLLRPNDVLFVSAAIGAVSGPTHVMRYITNLVNRRAPICTYRTSGESDAVVILSLRLALDPLQKTIISQKNPFSTEPALSAFETFRTAIAAIMNRPTLENVDGITAAKNKYDNDVGSSATSWGKYPKKELIAVIKNINDIKRSALAIDSKDTAASDWQKTYVRDWAGEMFNNERAKLHLAADIYQHGSEPIEAISDFLASVFDVHLM